MNERLYYEDAYRTSFVAQVTERLTLQDQPAVRISRSAFYPTSGGQPHDTGRLNGTAVVDVQVGADGAVLHLLAHSLPEETTSVNGQIDWPRRYDHMQQHSGQHLLSQVFFRNLGLETVSVHFGDAMNTLDLDGPTAHSVGNWQTVETAVNEMVWQDRSIRAYWITDAERDKVPLRRAPTVQGKMRIVEIGKFDWSACGGTHVRRTGEIGLISLLRIEKHRGRSRVHFVCGGTGAGGCGAAPRAAGGDGRIAGQLACMTCPIWCRRMQDALRGAEKELNAQGEALVRISRRANCWRLPKLQPVCGWWRGSWPMLNRRRYRSWRGRSIAEPGVVALLGCAQRGKGTVVFARSQDLSLHVGNLLRNTLKQFGGGGGGRPDFAQGGGVAAEKLTAVLEAAAEAVRREVG